MALEQRKADTLTIEIADSLRVLGGRLFSPDFHHLYVQLDDRQPGGSFEVVAAVFGLDGWDLSREPVVLERTSGMNYVADTLRDTNGDGFRDYVVHTYSSAGCCLRNVNKIRLFDPASGGFAPAFELMNPTYYPSEGLIRGVMYGHPGEVPLYKSRFMGLREPERIECIFRVREQPGRYIQGHCEQGGHRPEGDTLDALPPEYESVEDLDWFLLGG